MEAKTAKALRRRLGLTQVELAEQLELAPITIRRYEQGRHKIPRIYALALRYMTEH